MEVRNNAGGHKIYDGQRTGIGSRCKVIADGRRHRQLPYELDPSVSMKSLLLRYGEIVHLVAFNYNHFF